MSVPPESIQIGKCYLVNTERGMQVRRVLEMMLGGRVQYEYRREPVQPDAPPPRRKLTSLASFAAVALREVPCDWSPGGASEP